MTHTNDQVRIAIAQQAAEWYTTNREESAPQRSRVEFMRWLRTSPLHVEEYLMIAATARDLRSAADDPQLSIDALLAEARHDAHDNILPLDAPAGAVAAGRRTSWLRAHLLASAVAVLGVLGGGLLWLHAGGDAFPGRGEIHETAHGEQRAWRLTDGSTVQLNTDSAVRVRFASDERLVEVTRGQAYFQVAKEAQRHFRVAVGAASIVAVGTQFDVYRRSDHALVTVVEGRVDIRRGQGAATGVAASAGQQVHIDASGQASPPAATDLRQAEAWRQGRISFDQQPLGAIAAEFNRYAPVAIEIDDPALQALPISGSFDIHDVASFLDFLQATDGVTIRHTPLRIFVLSTAHPAAERSPGSR